MPNLDNDIWNHFDIKDDVYAICTYCDRTLSYKTTTGNLRLHLKRHGVLNSSKSESVSNDQEQNILEEGETLKEEVEDEDQVGEVEELEEEVWQDSEGEVWEAVISEDEISIEEFSKKDIPEVSNDSTQIKTNKDHTHLSKSSVWKYFDKIDDHIACCKYCSRDLSYKSTTGNLYTHIKKKHMSSYLLNEGKTTEDMMKKRRRSKMGKIWEYFYKINDTYATCKKCKAKLSYRSSSGNLTAHLRKQHGIPSDKSNQVIDVYEDKNNDNDRGIPSDKSNQVIDVYEDKNNDNDRHSTDPIPRNSKLPRKQKVGRIWAHFNKIDNIFAVCKYCNKAKLSYRTTSGNLGKHLKRSHPEIYLIYIKDTIAKNVNNHKGEIKDETPGNKSNIWKYFYKKDNELAICKYCSLHISYDSNEDLNTHLRKSHTQIYMTLQIDSDENILNNRNEEIATNNSDPDTDNYSDQDVTHISDMSDSEQNPKSNCKSPSFHIKTKEGMMEISTFNNEPSEFNDKETPNKISEIWKHFHKRGKKIASCKYCNKHFSYTSSTGNLRCHLNKKHGLICLPQQDNIDQITTKPKKEIWMVQTSSNDEPSDSALNQNKTEIARKTGEIWTHFDKIDNMYATCRYCNIVLSYKSTTGNLTSHLRKTHISIYMAQRINSDSNIVWICNDSTQLPTEEASQPKRQKTIQNNITKLTQAEKMRADRNLLGLFIYDLQSFSIVEDPGFVSFVNSISEYSLPSKKEISSKIIPAIYNKTLTELRETVSRDACTVCLTIECWSTLQKKDYIAVTAHYIDIHFNLQSVILECANLNNGRTSDILTQEIKRIISEWNLCTKVIFAVADNSKNIEHAIENLGWNGYVCYAHALNLIFLNGLKPVTRLIGDIKKIIRHFKNSTNVQEMLTNYQMRNSVEDQDSKDLIEDVSSHWSGTLSMLRRFVQLNEAIQYCMALDDTEWPVFNSEDWEIASQLCEVLETFEEVTSSIVGDQYMSASLIIIITNCLKTICDDFLEKEEYSHHKPEIKEVVSYINSDLTERFSTIEFNKDIALCTLLDPRFKCYGFHDDNAYTDIKDHVQNLLIEKIDNEYNLTKTEVDTDTRKDISAWDKFDKILKQKEPRRNSSVRADRELQMYLDDDMMPRKNLDGHWNNPAQWWREHQIIYPNLSEIYRTRCNVVGTCVPWDRLYSKKGLIMRERRNNLNEDEAKKLVFLNATLDETKFKENVCSF